jgi:hypothetical protein
VLYILQSLHAAAVSGNVYCVLTWTLLLLLQFEAGLREASQRLTSLEELVLCFNNPAQQFETRQLAVLASLPTLKALTVQVCKGAREPLPSQQPLCSACYRCLAAVDQRSSSPSCTYAFLFTITAQFCAY